MSVSLLSVYELLATSTSIRAYVEDLQYKQQIPDELLVIEVGQAEKLRPQHITGIITLFFLL